MSNRRSLEVSSHNGRLMAGYLTFGRRPGDVSVRTAEPEPGLVVDYAADARPIGLEITSPSRVTLESINRVLESLGEAPATEKELSLLFATRGGTAVGGRLSAPPVASSLGADYADRAGRRGIDNGPFRYPGDRRNRRVSPSATWRATSPARSTR